MNSTNEAKGLGGSAPPPQINVTELQKEARLSPSYTKTRIVQDICETFGIETAAGREFLIIALENAVLMDRKQRDYGSKNISGYGMFGVVVRMSDKFERIKNLFNNKRKKAVNESIRDSLKDISNYAIIALMIESGKWPEK